MPAHSHAHRPSLAVRLGRRRWAAAIEILCMTAGALIALQPHAATAHPTAASAGSITSRSAVAAAATTSVGSTTTPNLYVTPSGSDSAPGTSSAPLRSIQRALDLATPGTTIRLAAGVYPAGGKTRRSGTASQPITIEGPAAGVDPRTGVPATPTTATVYGTGHILAIGHSYYTLKGFTINGQRALDQRVPSASWPGQSLPTAQSFKNSVANLIVNSRPLYIDGGSGPSVAGTRIYRMTIEGSGGECVRVRSNAADTSITQTVIQWCGMYPYSAPGGFTYHNGEGVYLGTSPKSTSLVNYANDRTRRTVISEDLIRTFGSECMDVKENSFSNTLANSTCAANLEPTDSVGSNIELRGYNNRVVGNTISGSAGYGIKIASDTAAQDRGGNVIEENRLSGLTDSALYNTSRVAQGTICGNSATPSPAAPWSGPC